MREDGKNVEAELFFQKGVARNARNQFQKTQNAIDRGSSEVAETHLKKGLESLKTYADNLVSPRLTPEENARWKDLRDRDWTTMPDFQQRELKTLNSKALGNKID